MITLAFDLSNIGTILLFAIMICVLIAWHELGHLIVAKKCNVYCYEYSIGFGPVIYSNKKKETHFTLRAIPFGGYVKMAGEEGVEEGEVLKGNNGEEIPSDRILANQSKGKRALVMAAGGIMNMILAVVCFYFFVSFGKPFADSDVTGFIETVHTNEVAISENMILSKQGMETGDKIIQIRTRLVDDGKTGEYTTVEINKFSKINKTLNEFAPQDFDEVQEIIITFIDVDENNIEKTIAVNRTFDPVLDEDGNFTYDDKGEKIGAVSKIGLGQTYKFHEYNALTGLYGAWHFMGYYTTEICRVFGNLFQGDFSGLSGLVGIYGTIDQVATDQTVGFGTTILRMVYILGAISFSLGFFNLIPFPALDGGRLVFVGIEAITKKKVNPNVEATIHFVGIIILFALMIIINIRDVINLF
ncbi:MAG: RIP metalloprotease RseP [Bacilli bacterium]|nr:RIP metalloprotease RseP [Bacilli bacterium]